MKKEVEDEGEDGEGEQKKAKFHSRAAAVLYTLALY